MKESGYYPPGAEFDPSAPWNQSEPPEKEFDICISQSLSKRTKVATSNYVPYYEEESGITFAETDNTDWQEVCDDCGVLTPLELITEFKRFLQENMYMIEPNTMRRHRWTQLLEECEGWTSDELEIIEE